MSGPQFKLDSETILRLPETNDVKPFFDCISENLDHLSAWRSWTDDLLTLHRVQQFIERNRHAHLEVLSPDFQRGGHPGFSFLIVHQGVPAGMAGFQGINRTNDIAALGYWISKKFTGKGLVTGACRLVIHYAFEVLDINRVEIQTLTQNLPSIRVAERLGFTREAELKQVEKQPDGTYHDHYLYRLLKESRP